MNQIHLASLMSFSAKHTLKTLMIAIIVCCFSEANASQVRKVLLIGIDGCRSDALQQANTPTIDSLLGTSLYSNDSWHLGITISGPSWSTILTGTNWNKHGVKGNSYAGSNFNSYPYFTKRAKEIKPNLKCVEISEWAPLLNEVYNDGMDLKIKTDAGGDSTTAEALRQLQDSSLDCLFTYYEAVDRAGHASGFSTGNSAYINSIEYVDTQMALLFQGLKNRVNYQHEDWLVLVVTDHGGVGLAHGGNSWAERHIWWIASGTAINPGQIIAGDPGTYNFLATGIFNSLGVNKNLMKQSPVQADIAVTALHHLIFDSGILPENYPAWKLDGKSWLTNTIGIEAIENSSEFNLYPNPANEKISINLSGTKNETIILNVYDLSGRLILAPQINVSANLLEIDVSQLTSGTYLSKIQVGKKGYSKKFNVLH